MRITLDVPLRMDEICEAINAKSDEHADKDKYISAICTDTRECEKGDLFIALSGKRDDGERYLKDAVTKKCYAIARTKQKGVLKVKDTSEALLKIAELYKSKTRIKCTVAVTGSVGKSTTVKFLTRILGEKHRVISPIGNFNNHIGVPLTILRSDKDTEILIAELGMNHKNEISRLSRCVKPDIGIITSIGTAHIGNLGSRENIANAKLEILDGMKDGVLLVPADEPLLRGIKNGLSVGRNSSVSHFSLNDRKDGEYYLSSPYGNIGGIRFFDARDHLLSDLSFAISAAQIIGLSADEIIKRAGAITVSDLRQRFITLNDFTIFDDSYNASLESITADLKYISAYKGPTGAFLGDVLELGANANSIHEDIGRMAADLGINRIYLYGNYSKATAMGALKAGMPSTSIFINTDLSSPEISVKHIMDNHAPGELILFKASHNIRLDKIADSIAEEERIRNERY